MNLRPIILNILLFFISRGWLRSKIFRLGKGAVVRYTILECKWLFSIYVHHIGTSCQDRFHTHAFNAWVWILSGGYTETVKNGIGPNCETAEVTFNAGQWRYIPRLMNHRLGQAAPNTYTLLLTGPWAHIWTEEIVENGEVRILLNPGARKIYSNKNE